MQADSAASGHGSDTKRSGVARWCPPCNGTGQVAVTPGQPGDGTMPCPECERRHVADQADLLLDGIIVALQEFDTETLRAIADYRDSIHKDGWMQRVIREYIEVWR